MLAAAVARPLMVPVGEALRDIGSRAAGGAADFLSRIAAPVADEFGLLMRDAVRHYRLGNLAATLSRAEAIMKASGALNGPQAGAPRVVMRLLDEASWIEDSELQNLWAGLLASSCTEDGKDESNLPFIAKLKELTSSQARLLRYACERSPKRRDGPSGLICVQTADEHEEPAKVPTSELLALSGHQDLHALDLDLDHLRALSLIDDSSGFMVGQGAETLHLLPTALALHLYVRVNGSRQSPLVYFCVPASACLPT